jgi:hypothetical protein
LENKLSLHFGHLYAWTRFDTDARADGYLVVTKVVSTACIYIAGQVPCWHQASNMFMTKELLRPDNSIIIPVSATAADRTWNKDNPLRACKFEAGKPLCLLPTANNKKRALGQAQIGLARTKVGSGVGGRFTGDYTSVPLTPANLEVRNHPSVVAVRARLYATAASETYVECLEGGLQKRVAVPCMASVHWPAVVMPMSSWTTVITISEPVYLRGDWTGGAWAKPHS